MLVAFLPMFVADIKITFVYNFVAPLKLESTSKNFPPTGKEKSFWDDNIFQGSEKNFEEQEKFNFVRKDLLKWKEISTRKLILYELLPLNFKHKNTIKRKVLWVWPSWCGKFLWTDTRKESFMFCLRDWTYLITSFSSSTLLLDILIFHSDDVFVLFNNLLHSTISLADNTIEYFIW